MQKNSKSINSTNEHELKAAIKITSIRDSYCQKTRMEDIVVLSTSVPSVLTDGPLGLPSIVFLS